MKMNKQVSSYSRPRPNDDSMLRILNMNIILFIRMLFFSLLLLLTMNNVQECTCISSSSSQPSSSKGPPPSSSSSKSQQQQQPPQQQQQPQPPQPQQQHPTPLTASSSYSVFLPKVPFYRGNHYHLHQHLSINDQQQLLHHRQQLEQLQLNLVKQQHQKQQHQKRKQSLFPNSPILIPKDILYNERTQTSLQMLRDHYIHSTHDLHDEQLGHPQSDVDNSSSSTTTSSSTKRKYQKAIHNLYKQKVCNDDGVTLTMMGYKDRLIDNQDRSFVHSPFLLSSQAEANKNGLDNKDDGNNDGNNANAENDKQLHHQINQSNVMQLMGIFDGHGKNGEEISEYCSIMVPKLLERKLYSKAAHPQDGGEINLHLTPTIMKDIFHDIYTYLNATAPVSNNGSGDFFGGTTASILFRWNNKICIANVGDSQTLLFSYHESGESDYDNKGNDHNNCATNQTSRKKSKQPIYLENLELIYQSQEDKPSLRQEKERIEKCGGYIYTPSDPRRAFKKVCHDSSRLVLTNEENGLLYGLELSRAIGDWSFTRFGLISDPIVQVIDIDKIMTVSKDSQLFAVSATDGLLKYVSRKEIGEVMAKALYFGRDITVDDDDDHDDDNNNIRYHVTIAAEELIQRAAHGWYDDEGPSYRDDITIAAIKIF